MNHDEMVKLARKPYPGLIPRGVTASIRTLRNRQTGQIVRTTETWQVSKGDLLQAHKYHVRSAAYVRETDKLWAAIQLREAALIRRMLFPRKRITTLDLLRGRA